MEIGDATPYCSPALLCINEASDSSCDPVRYIAEHAPCFRTPKKDRVPPLILRLALAEIQCHDLLRPAHIEPLADERRSAARDAIEDPVLGQNRDALG